jgi:carbamate kinase
MSDYAVIAFGGNAILPSGQRGTLEEQRQNVRRMAAQLGRLVVEGHRVVVTHGNGPQVGEIMLRSEMTADTVPPLTLDVGGAMSQGQIGYMLQQEIDAFLAHKRLRRPVCSLVTQVVVERDDPAFRTPTKPIGRFYSAQDAAELRNERGWTLVEDAGRGYRRVVPSPKPRSIVEWEAVKVLVESGALVIAAGGGGIPVIEEEGRLRGVEAVIDKDRAAQKLASLVGARTLVLLTEVDHVAIDFGTPRQRSLGEVTVEEMREHLEAGQFPPGSMGPKVEAAVDFVESGGDRTIITSTEKLVRAMDSRRIGTQIVAEVSARRAPAPVAARAP